MRHRFLLCCLLAATALSPLRAQDDLLQAAQAATPAQETTLSAFKGVRLINGQTVETWKKGELGFVIQHRFGRIDQGWYDFFGLDNANIRLGLDYGISDRVNVGIGRNSLQKAWDGFFKWQALQQRTGARPMPVTLSLLGGVYHRTERANFAGDDSTGAQRTSFTVQALVARRITSALSLQLMPTLVNRLYMPGRNDRNALIAMGVGGRLKVSKRVAITAEYYYRVDPTGTDALRWDPFGIGVDIETGGHVFQLHFSNSQAMTERAFLSSTVDALSFQNLYFGFNITRALYLRKDARSEWKASR